MSFSRDGKQLSYVSYPDGVLWRAKPNGSERIQLTSPPIYPIACTWSPDGTKILFTAERDPLHYGLYVVSSEGGKPDLLVSGDSRVGATGGVWSPDGHKIAYGDNVSSGLHIIDLDRQVTFTIPGSEGLFAPSWSPDGNYIAAIKEPGNALAIFNLNTQQWSPLSEHMGGGYLSWSHDGRSLYVLSHADGWSIFRFPIPRGEPTRVAKLNNTHLTGVYGAWLRLDPEDGFLLLRDIGTRDIYSLTLVRK